MDKPTRNLIQRMTQEARRLLEREYGDQLESAYDIRPDGTTGEDMDGRLGEDGRLVRAKLVAAVAHARASGAANDAEAVAAYVREAAFTTLNRFVALKMLEARGLVRECVSRGDQSSGFKEYGGLAPGLVQLPDKGYRLYIESLFDELGTEVKVLFDRRDPASMLWPRPKALADLLVLLNAPDLADVWSADETLGWVYQYFNGEDERRQMRVESGAPRNSRELAVRNQFFTPRYVVEFLTDNTLGRTWYEMRRGDTVLAEHCKYLVKRPNEVFMPGPENTAAAPPQSEWVRAVSRGDFTQLPESPSPEELSELALVHNGYDLAERLGMGDVIHWADDHVERHKTGGGWPESPLDLWLILFRYQRYWARDYFDDDGRMLAEWQACYQAFHSAVTHREQRQEAPSDWPTFVPYRPAKDPRDIRLLDPACGSMHFGLYAFDLFAVIYEEAWDAGRVPPEDFGFREKAVLQHDTVRFAPSPTVQSGYHSQPVPFDTAYVMITRRGDDGDGVYRNVPYVVGPDTRFRVPADFRVPLTEFDYQAVLRDGWFDEAVGEELVRGAGCFTFDEDPAVSLDEAHANFRRQVPALILRHNLHGVDIDPRAIQIAALTLWMRAQRAYNDTGIPHAERQPVTRTNVVVAEPMPGEADLRAEFVAQLDPRLGRLVERVFERMELAGEMGPLLRIEEDIQAAVRETYGEFGAMFRASDEARWQEAEEALLDALRSYAEQAAGAAGYRRRLFAEDAAHGFAFIDLCRQRYDVVLMNPPFGAGSLRAKASFEKAYPRTKNDVYAAFVERGVQLLLKRAMLGAITSRTGFFLSSFQKWREEVLLKEAPPRVFADLGYGVLDSAMVEVAAYCLEVAE